MYAEPRRRSAFNYVQGNDKETSILDQKHRGTGPINILIIGPFGSQDSGEHKRRIPHSGHAAHPGSIHGRLDVRPKMRVMIRGDEMRGRQKVEKARSRSTIEWS